MKKRADFRRYIQYRRSKANPTTKHWEAVRLFMQMNSVILDGIAKRGSRLPPGEAGGTVYGTQIALIGDDPNRKEYILPSEILNKL